MNSNFVERNNLIFQTINNNDFNNNISQNQSIKKYWCHLCKKEFSHEYQNDDVKCLFCNKTFCEIIENEDTSNPLHPIHFEPFTFNNSNSQNINTQNENSINNNDDDYAPYISRPSLTMSNILRRVRSLQLLNFIASLHFQQNHRDNIDDIISHLMLHDTNKYGNPPAAKKEVEKLKKYIINEEKKANISFVIQGLIQIFFTLLLARVLPHDAPWYATLAANIAVILYFAFYCNMFSDLKPDTKTDLMYITGGYASSSVIKGWSDAAKKYLSEDEFKTVCSKLLYPFENALDPKIKVPCSFIIIQSDVDERSVVLRYLAKHDITGTQGDTDDEDEKRYGEVICSEFNFARRMIIYFKDQR